MSNSLTLSIPKAKFDGDGSIGGGCELEGIGGRPSRGTKVQNCENSPKIYVLSPNLCVSSMTREVSLDPKRHNNENGVFSSQLSKGI